MELTDLVRQYVRYGLTLVPIPQGQKGPITSGWNLRENVITEPSAHILVRGNVGLAHAYCEPTPTVALDFDDLALSRGWFEDRGLDLDKYLEAEDAVQILSGRANRAKLLYRLPPGMKPLTSRKILDFRTGNVLLEFRCASKNGTTVQDVLPPSIHPETGKPYEWGGLGDWRKIPTIPEELLAVWPKDDPKETRVSEESKGDITKLQLDYSTIQHLRSALLHLSSDDRELWVKVGLAIKNLGDVGRRIWLEWSSSSTKFDAEDAARVWDSLHPDGIGYKFVFAEAQRQGWVNPTKNCQGEIKAAETPADWPKPLPLPDGLLPVEPLDPSILPSTIREAVVDITERLNCPIEFVAIPVLTAAGIAIGNRIGVLPKQFDDSWEVYPGFWGGIVGNPGSMKTPAQNEAFRCLHHLEEQASVANAQAMDTYNKDMKIYDKQVRDFKSGKSSVWPAEPKKPLKVRYIVHDVTYQALGEILAENPSGVLALADEMSGLLQSLDTAGQEAARGFFLQGWGGRGNYTFDRITRGTVVLKNYMLSLFGGFQPDRIKLYVRAASNGSSQNDGLMQRFQLLVWPDVSDEIRIVDRPPNKAAIHKMESAIIQLRGLATAGLPEFERNSFGASLLHFDDTAQAMFENWYLANEAMLRREDISQAEHSHFAKYRSLIPGLALVHHLLEGHKGRICADCLQKALNLAFVLKSHAHRVYASVYGLDNEPLRNLAKRIVKGELSSGFTARTVYTKGWAGLTKATVATALEQLAEMGWVREVAVPTEGRTSVQYLINPHATQELLK
jgi:hypothetical protein